MNKDDKLIETLINATEKNKMKWNIENLSEVKFINQTYSLSQGLVHTIDKESTVVLIKYGTQLEKIDLLLFNTRKDLNSPMLVIEEDDLLQSHRLWTLYKLAERNASGADKLIDDIIFKYSDDIPF